MKFKSLMSIIATGALMTAPLAAQAATAVHVGPHGVTAAHTAPGGYWNPGGPYRPACCGYRAGGVAAGVAVGATLGVAAATAARPVYAPPTVVYAPPVVYAPYGYPY